MGNCGLGGHAHFSKQVVKLVHSNGLVEEFHGPLKAGELLVDYPKHFICHADGLSQLFMRSSNSLLASGLSEEDEMEIGQAYFLLPKRMLDTAPSEKDIAALMSKASTARKESYKGSTLAPLPPPAESGGYGHTDEEDENEDDDEDAAAAAAARRAFLQRVLAEAKLQMEKRSAADPSLGNQLDSDEELQKAFASHILARSCSRLWRPPLDTIQEEATSTRGPELTCDHA